MYLDCLISFFVVLFILMIYLISDLCKPIDQHIKKIRIIKPRIDSFIPEQKPPENADLELKNAIDAAYDSIF